MGKRSGKIRAYGMLLVAVVIWGVSYPVTKYALRFLPPFLLAFLRFSLASVFFLPLLRGKASIRPEDRRSFLLLGLTGSFFLIAFMNLGLRFASAVSGSILSATPPLFTAVLALYFLRERLGLGKAGGLLLGLLGIVLVARFPAGFKELSGRAILGNGLILAAQLSWAFYAILGKRAVERYGGETVAGWTSIVGAVLFLPFAIAETAWATGSSWTTSYNLTWGCVLAILYLSLLNTTLTYLFWNRSLRVVGASTAAGFLYLQPLSGALVSVLFLGEELRAGLVAGGGLILLGVSLILRSEKKD